MSTDTQSDTQRRTADDRYRYVEYDTDGSTVSIIQDSENQRAWIQSTLSVDVER